MQCTFTQMRVHILRTFVTHLLVHIHQKKKIANKIAAKFASVNGPLVIVLANEQRPKLLRGAQGRR